MEKVVVSPLEVRGHGNVIDEKGLFDFDRHAAAIPQSVRETVDGNSLMVYTCQYLVGSALSVSYNGFVPYTENLTSFPVTAVLKTNTGSAISSVHVYCTVNGDSLNSKTTGTNGSVTFDVPFVDGVSEYLIRLYYPGTGNRAGSGNYAHVFVGNVDSVEMGVTEPVIQSGSVSRLVAKVDGHDRDDVTHPIPGATVEFLKYNPELFKYVGTGGTETDSFYYNETYITESVSSYGTIFVNNDSSNARIMWANLTGTSSSEGKDYAGDSVVDFILVSCTGTVTFNMESDRDTYSKVINGVFDKVTVEYKDGEVRYFVNGVEEGAGTAVDLGRYAVLFSISPGGSVMFKDFRIGGY